MQLQGEEKLKHILEKYKNENKDKKYDCMVGVSGGRDSTFLMWKLVTDYNMRVLAVHYDNPFNSLQATKNLDNTLKQLNIDCVKTSFKEGYHINETRKALEAWSHKPSHSMLPIICSVCKGWWPDFFKVAKDNNIGLIMIGSNPLETASFKEKSFGGARTYLKLSRMPNTMKKGIEELISNPRYLYKCSWSAVIKGFLMASHSSPIAKRLYKNIYVIRLFDYIKWDENEVLTTITENLNWKKAPEHESPWRFDCKLDHIKKYLYLKTIGVSELEDLFSKMIREGMISREEALKRLQTENETSIELVDEVLDIMNLKLSDLNWPKDWKFKQHKEIINAI